MQTERESRVRCTPRWASWLSKGRQDLIGGGRPIVINYGRPRMNHVHCDPVVIFNSRIGNRDVVAPVTGSNPPRTLFQSGRDLDKPEAVFACKRLPHLVESISDAKAFDEQFIRRSE